MFDLEAVQNIEFPLPHFLLYGQISLDVVSITSSFIRHAIRVHDTDKLFMTIEK